MPRPKNYAFEKAQRERARIARRTARKEASQAAKTANPDGTEATDTDVDASDATAADKDPEVS